MLEVDISDIVEISDNQRDHLPISVKMEDQFDSIQDQLTPLYRTIDQLGVPSSVRFYDDETAIIVLDFRDLREIGFEMGQRRVTELAGRLQTMVVPPEIGAEMEIEDASLVRPAKDLLPSKKVQVIESSSKEPEKNAEEAGSNDSMSDGEKEEFEQVNGVSVDNKNSIGAEDADSEEQDDDGIKNPVSDSSESVCPEKMYEEKDDPQTIPSLRLTTLDTVEPSMTQPNPETDESDAERSGSNDLQEEVAEQLPSNTMHNASATKTDSPKVAAKMYNRSDQASRNRLKR